MHVFNWDLTYFQSNMPNLKQSIDSAHAFNRKLLVDDVWWFLVMIISILLILKYTYLYLSILIYSMKQKTIWSWIFTSFPLHLLKIWIMLHVILKCIFANSEESRMDITFSGNVFFLFVSLKVFLCLCSLSLS